MVSLNFIIYLLSAHFLYDSDTYAYNWLYNLSIAAILHSLWIFITLVNETRGMKERKTRVCVSVCMEAGKSQSMGTNSVFFSFVYRSTIVARLHGH